VRSLADLKPGEEAIVQSFVGTGTAIQRLQEMGITENVPITVLNVAPLGDPVEIRVRGYQLSVRLHEAKLIMVSQPTSD
jgi:ferrous iron transport protein A